MPGRLLSRSPQAGPTGQPRFQTAGVQSSEDTFLGFPAEQFGACCSCCWKLTPPPPPPLLLPGAAPGARRGVGGSGVPEGKRPRLGAQTETQGWVSVEERSRLPRGGTWGATTVRVWWVGPPAGPPSPRYSRQQPAPHRGSPGVPRGPGHQGSGTERGGVGAQARPPPAPRQCGRGDPRAPTGASAPEAQRSGRGEFRSAGSVCCCGSRSTGNATRDV